MKADSGARMRLNLLRQGAERKVLEPLRLHGWIAAVERESAGGEEFLILTAARGDASHRVALLYSCASSNALYKQLATEVEHIFFNGEPYHQESYASGLDKPVGPVDEFPALLVQWNEASRNGKFADVASEDFGPPTRRSMRILLSETPIEAVWLRLRQLQSVTLAEKMIADRARRESASLEPSVLRAKAEGVSYALRNAADYFRKGDEHAIGQRIVNLYYGTLSFAFAEILASPSSADTLETLENSTKQGHGLYTVDAVDDGAKAVAVGMLGSGFFPAWMAAIGVTIAGLPSRRPRSPQDLATVNADTWILVEDLFATIPEVADLFADIFDTPPRWIRPAGDMEANLGQAFGPGAPRSQSYIKLVDQFGRLTAEDIARFPGPISDIREVDSKGDGRHYRVLVKHEHLPQPWDALELHHSPFERSALLLPIFGVIHQYRVICLVLLYALSIIVRYRPSLWRRIQDGDLDHLRALIDAFIAVAERILPQAFLETVAGQPVFARQPAGF
ncbi:hypothetical protein GALL_263430 [mine drainage metagenome]|uniref:YaaC-like Protein n=1 Tax=mine drainage metagenome TaxID=410659 RepID=A0A1J5R6U9_9ZZZZ